MNTNIKDKIQKLLALASSPNENEAKAALLKAKELMAKNKLSEEDIAGITKQDLKELICNNIAWTTDSGKGWMVDLCQILCDNYCCSASWRTPAGSRTHTLVIAGLDDDAEVCKSIVEYAIGFVESTIKHLQRKYYKQNQRAIANSYAKGFILGIELAFEAQSENHPEWGLVVTKPDEVRKYENNLGSKSVKMQQTEFNPLAYMRGQIDGKEFNTKKVIGQCAN